MDSNNSRLFVSLLTQFLNSQTPVDRLYNCYKLKLTLFKRFPRTFSLEISLFKLQDKFVLAFAEHRKLLVDFCAENIGFSSTFERSKGIGTELCLDFIHILSHCNNLDDFLAVSSKLTGNILSGLQEPIK